MIFWRTDKRKDRRKRSRLGKMGAGWIWMKCLMEMSLS